MPEGGEKERRLPAITAESWTSGARRVGTRAVSTGPFADPVVLESWRVLTVKVESNCLSG
jgi:hypothetical protein